MRLLVCGGRDYGDVGKVYDTLDEVHAGSAGPISLVIEGGATGADALARKWAKDRRVPVRTYKAHWTKHGNAAGPIRNQLMIDDGKPNAVIAFPGGHGTADMVLRAKAAGLKPLEMYA